LRTVPAPGEAGQGRAHEGTEKWGITVANSTTVAIFGGFAPYIATWLNARMGSPIAPTF